MVKRFFSHTPTWTPLIFLVLLFSYPASAAELSVEDTYAAPGEEVTVSILIDDATDLLSADITLSYDQGILTAIGAETTSLTSDCIIAHTINWGEISLSLASDTALTGGRGALVDVTFGIAEAAEEGETTLSISDAALYDSDYQVKTLTTVDGTVTIATTATTTTTTDSQSCLSEVLYGEHSSETEALRYIRDNVFSQTPEGKELISLYYQWSPVIVEVMENDEEFSEEVEEMIDGLLKLIEGEAE